MIFCFSKSSLHSWFHRGRIRLVKARWLHDSKWRRAVKEPLGQQRDKSDYCLLTRRLFAARDYGASQSHQHRNGGWYRQQRDGEVEGRHSCQPEQAGVRLHCELPWYPLQSAAEGRNLLQEEDQSKGDTGGPQVSFPHCVKPFRNSFLLKIYSGPFSFPLTVEMTWFGMTITIINLHVILTKHRNVISRSCSYFGWFSIVIRLLRWLLSDDAEQISQRKK